VTFLVSFIRAMAFNTFQQYFSYIVAVSFIWQSTQRKPQTCHKSIPTNKQTNKQQIHDEKYFFKILGEVIILDSLK
jgi:hypothetical protein